MGRDNINGYLKCYSLKKDLNHSSFHKQQLHLVNTKLYYFLPQSNPLPKH